MASVPVGAPSVRGCVPVSEGRKPLSRRPDLQGPRWARGRGKRRGVSHTRGRWTPTAAPARGTESCFAETPRPARFTAGRPLSGQAPALHLGSRDLGERARAARLRLSLPSVTPSAKLLGRVTHRGHDGLGVASVPLWVAALTTRADGRRAFYPLQSLSVLWRERGGCRIPPPPGWVAAKAPHEARVPPRAGRARCPFAWLLHVAVDPRKCFTITSHFKL